MTLRLRRTKAADSDIDEIWSYIAAHDTGAANRLVDRIEAAERRLAEYPELGPARRDIRDGIRSWIVGAYIILYTRTEDTLLVVRVTHGSRDLPNLEL